MERKEYPGVIYQVPGVPGMIYYYIIHGIYHTYIRKVAQEKMKKKTQERTHSFRKSEIKKGGNKGIRKGGEKEGFGLGTNDRQRNKTGTTTGTRKKK